MCGRRCFARARARTHFQRAFVLCTARVHTRSRTRAHAHSVKPATLTWIVADRNKTCEPPVKSAAGDVAARGDRAPRAAPRRGDGATIATRRASRVLSHTIHRDVLVCAQAAEVPHTSDTRLCACTHFVSRARAMRYSVRAATAGPSTFGTIGAVATPAAGVPPTGSGGCCGSDRDGQPLASHAADDDSSASNATPHTTSALVV